MRTVKVRLRKPNRVFTFLCNESLALRREEPCVVRSDRGLEFGFVVTPPEECGADAEERFKMTVVRAASDHDQLTHRQLQDDELRARRLCREKIRERQLAMKLVEVEYTFDRKKIIFYFTAEDRVDFRELVRDLAHDLKARIELRHIQVRDEAKMVGGIGSCGRELCCTTWMREFIPISMKMAKRQNLSLNPTKISGQCGRLMCCLSYENELYKKQKKAIGGPVYTLDPDFFAQARDRMESNAPFVVQTLMGTSLREVVPVPDDDEPYDIEDELEDEDVVEEVAFPEPAEAATPGQETAVSEEKAKRNRRRRRPRRRGGKKGGPGGNN